MNFEDLKNLPGRSGGIVCTSDGCSWALGSMGSVDLPGSCGGWVGLFKESLDCGSLDLEPDLSLDPCSPVTSSSSKKSSGGSFADRQYSKISSFSFNHKAGFS